MYVCACSGVSVMCDFFATLWTVDCQAPLSMGFSRQEYWSGLPFLPPGNLPNLVIELASPALQADSLLLSHRGSQYTHTHTHTHTHIYIYIYTHTHTHIHICVYISLDIDMHTYSVGSVSLENSNT